MGKKEKRSNDDHFMVCHFAADVVYFAGEFLDKNNDSLDAAAEGVLLGSKLPLVVTIATPEGGVPDPKKKKGGFQSVGKKVRGGGTRGGACGGACGGTLGGACGGTCVGTHAFSRIPPEAWRTHDLFHQMLHPPPLASLSSRSRT